MIYESLEGEVELLHQKQNLRIAMLGHKRIPSREGGVEVVVEELSTRMVALGHEVTCYNRKGHHVSGKNFDSGVSDGVYKGIILKSVPTIDKKGLAAMSSSLYCYILIDCVRFKRPCCF